ncbi:hypothetical protein [Pseudoduganella ginsengisoli]|uniref:Uncharacterized protein n=1 Tax=Pseudoduganella ginsengisoli TaxID=1462440 RepID=A0A6L6PZV2_9BURK|nr:hypothetical protein [Pseudoduganella ginsengisoli]MTW02766.1 hypothetical protein [Pseudoduganella ginsengisoli]
MKRLPVLISLLCFTIFTAPAQAKGQGDSRLSNASEELSMAGGIVVLGSMSAVAASGYVVVSAVETVADGVVVVLKGASAGVEASVQLSGAAAQGLSDAAGKAVTVTATSTGHILVMSGKMLAFIPNELGKSLLHHSRVDA